MRSIIFVWSCYLLFSCTQRKNETEKQHAFFSDNVNDTVQNSFIVPPYDSSAGYIYIKSNVSVKNYFDFLERQLSQTDTSTLGYELNEYFLIHANPRIIDTLEQSDYYRMMERGVFVYDQKEQIILHQGDSLVIPNKKWAHQIQQKLNAIKIVVNIPEFKMWVIQEEDTLREILARVGRDARKYLPVVHRTVSLKTPIGEGEIIRVARNPDFTNPATGKKYKGTHRDDGRYTMMPIIPWLEPTTDGRRQGAMIHPTTNPQTLGKSYSHGCIGVSEHDAWFVYYHAPIGTPVYFKYDLQKVNANGDTIFFNDIYHINNRR
jgi:hypothetical protein